MIFFPLISSVQTQLLQLLFVKGQACFDLFHCLISDKIHIAAPVPHLAVLQGQFKHVCCAANQTNSNAVQHHPFAAVEYHGGQVLGLYFTDELPKAGCDCILRGRALQDCRGKLQGV